MDTLDAVRKFSFATVGLAWAVSMTVCVWLFGLSSWDLTMIAVSAIVLTVTSSLAYAVMVRTLRAELGEEVATT